ncbi:MAG: bile acid:sodium symporter family protein [Bacteroidia bacterium]|nr:bile acid:sodium symporter family protein [Bacteroidia bacterium]
MSDNNTNSKLYSFLILFSNWLSAYTSPFIIAVAVITFFFPELFAWVTGYLQTYILGFIMLTMGLTLTVQDIKTLAHRPLDILIGFCAQYTIMPLIAYSLTVVFHLDTALAVGIILVGCCPGGVSSNIMSYLCYGDVAYSVGMTTASTLLSPMITPMLMLLLAGEKVEIDAIGMFINILIVTIIPITVGSLCNISLGHKEILKKAQKIMPSLSVLGLACIVGGVISLVHDDIAAGGFMLLLWTFLIVFCHNSIGYILGYLIGKIFHFNTAKRRTISIEVGMQNAGLATNLATHFFIVTCPLAVVPCAISCAWHSISGTILASFFAWSDKKKSHTRLRQLFSIIS